MIKKKIVAVVSATAILTTMLACTPTQAETEVKTTDFPYVDEYIQQTIDSIEKPSATDTATETDKSTFPITAEEKQLISEVVYAEARGEGYFGMCLIAECIRNACEIDGVRPAEAIKKYGYAQPKGTTNMESCTAVKEVFENGLTLAEEPIMFFYAPKRVKSEWHESQKYVLTHGNHKFFAKAE